LDTDLQLLAVLAVGIVSLWGAIPIGLAMGLNPWAVGVVAATGAALGTLAVSAVGDRIRNHPPTPLAKAAALDHGILYRIWIRYGWPGLGLAAPLFVGAPLGTAIGIILRAPTGRLLPWIMLGIVFWSAGLTYLAAMGLSTLQH